MSNNLKLTSNIYEENPSGPIYNESLPLKAVVKITYLQSIDTILKDLQSQLTNMSQKIDRIEEKLNEFE